MEKISIVDFNPDDADQMNVIAEIHKSVLPDSFVVMMGEMFMKKFYYKVLPKLNYLKCFLAFYDNRYVGMIVTNKKPYSLIRSAIPHHFFLIGWVMVVAVITDLRRIGVIIDLMKYKPDPLLKKFEDTGTAFEILTIGVIEKYRSITLSNNIKISHLLLKHAVDDYKSKKYDTITGQILKLNKGALGFYTKYQANFIQSSVRDYGVILELPIKNVVI